MLFRHFRFLSGRRPKRQSRSRTKKLYYFSFPPKNLRVAIESDLRPKKSPTSNVAMKYSRFQIDYYKIGCRLEKFPLLLFVWNKKFRHSIIVRHKSLDARKKRRAVTIAVWSPMTAGRSRFHERADWRANVALVARWRRTGAVTTATTDARGAPSHSRQSDIAKLADTANASYYRI